jgi:hypothetical protein
MSRPVERNVSTIVASLTPLRNTPFQSLDEALRGSSAVDFAGAAAQANRAANRGTSGAGVATPSSLASEAPIDHHAAAALAISLTASDGGTAEAAHLAGQFAEANSVRLPDTGADATAPGGDQAGFDGFAPPFVVAASTGESGGGAANASSLTLSSGGDPTGDFADSSATPSASPASSATFSATSSSGAASYTGAPAASTSSATGAVTIPSGSESEITYLTGVTNTDKVGSTSWALWNFNWPATYKTTGNVYKWGSGTPGTSGGTVTYWFDAASNWTANEKNELISGLKLWQSEANISFAQASSASAANFVFDRGTDKKAYWSTTSATQASVGDSTIGQISKGFISIDTSATGYALDGSFSTIGGFGYQTLVHEMGHMLGFGHGGPYNNGDGIAASVPSRQFGVYDTYLWSIMSYISPQDASAAYYSSYPVTGTSWGNAPDGYSYVNTTPMMLDIIGAQRLYGVPTSTVLSGGQTFGFNTNVDSSIRSYFDFTVNTHPQITLWDKGSNNTLDVSGFSQNATINLNASTFSSVNGEVNDIGIAEGTAIDKVVGGSGADTITGNPNNNTLDGGAGADTLIGGTGNDIYIVDNVGDVV